MNVIHKQLLCLAYLSIGIPVSIYEYNKMKHYLQLSVNDKDNMDNWVIPVILSGQFCITLFIHPLLYINHCQNGSLDRLFCNNPSFQIVQDQKDSTHDV